MENQKLLLKTHHIQMLKEREYNNARYVHDVMVLYSRVSTGVWEQGYGYDSVHVS